MELRVLPVKFEGSREDFVLLTSFNQFIVIV